MTGPIPGPAPGFIHRERITRVLAEADRAPVVVVSAPAGWGKTVALADWARGVRTGRAVHWVDSAAPADRLRAALAAAARHRVAHLPLIVIDNADRVSDPGSVALVAGLLAAPPTGRTIVLAGRGAGVGPPVPAGAVEVPAATLALTPDETADLLAAAGAPVPPAIRLALARATEGWPAGVALGAAALRGAVDTVDVLGAGGPFEDAVAGYVVAEVLGRLPNGLYGALLATAVTPELTDGLAEALLGHPDGGRVLAALRREGAFLDRRDGAGGWYRYHPLFARVVYRILRRQEPVLAVRQHRRAGLWLATYGPPAEALRHLLLARDWSAAAVVADRHRADLAAGAGFLAPDVEAPVPPGGGRPDARTVQALAVERLAAGDRDGLRRYLRDSDEPEPALRVAAAALGTDHEHTLALAGQLTDLPGDPDSVLAPLFRGGARARLGELSGAAEDLAAALAHAENAGMVQAQIVAASRLAMLAAVRGRLRDASRLGRQALATADRFGASGATALGWARLALASVSCDRDELDTAGHLLAAAAGTVPDPTTTAEPDLGAATVTVRARLYQSTGRPADALGVVTGARRAYRQEPLAAAVDRALTLTEAELRVDLREPAEAHRLVTGCGAGAGAGDFADWSAAVTAAALLAEGETVAALTALAPVLAGDAGSTTCRVRAALLSAAAGRRLGDTPGVLRGLARAVETAAPEDIRRPFVTGDAEVRALLPRYLPRLRLDRPATRRFADTLMVSADRSAPRQPT